MGVANNAAAVLVGFDIGYGSGDVNTSGTTSGSSGSGTSGSLRQEEE